MIKKIIGFLCSVIFCIAIAVGMPQMARGAEEVPIDVTNFPDEIFRDYVKGFDENNDEKLSKEEIERVTSINVWNKDIENLKGIEYFTALTELNCGANIQLSSLDISKNTALTTLECIGSRLNSLDVSKNTALTTLKCPSNQLSSLNVSKNTALKYLDCSNNDQLNSLDVNGATALTELWCYFTSLNSLDVSGATALTGLWCYSNRLSSLNIGKNTVLKYLACYDNQLNSLDTSGAAALKELGCDSNQLTSLDLSKNTALTYLSCRDNQLNSLNLSNNTMLSILACESNQLGSLNVSNNTMLTILSCNDNQLSSLNLSNNMLLTTLKCSNDLLIELKLHSNTYNELILYTKHLHGEEANLSDLQNIEVTDGILKVIDITKPATYKVDNKNFTITYVDNVVEPSAAPSIKPSITPSVEPTAIPSTMPSTVPSAEPTATPSTKPSAAPSAEPTAIPSDIHIFYDYNYTTPVTSPVVIYGNGTSQTIDGKKVNNKAIILYTDILASYKYSLNNKGVVKPSVGKVIVGITKSDTKPTVSSKNKITDTSASKIANARIKNGQITVTATGKEGGAVYLWVIDTGSKSVSACCPIDVKLAPKKLEVQSTSESKLIKPKLQNGTTLDIHIAGLVGSTKTDDCTYTATVDSKYQSYITVTPVDGSTNKFTIKATGLKNNKDTKVAITFKCDQNGKKTNFSLTITK